MQIYSNHIEISYVIMDKIVCTLKAAGSLIPRMQCGCFSFKSMRLLPARSVQKTSIKLLFETYLGIFSFIYM